MTAIVDEFVPELRTDVVRRDIAGERVVWSPVAPEPVVLDPVAAVMLDVVDGVASVGDLAREVHEEVGLPLERAQQEVTRIVEGFLGAGLLTSSATGPTAVETIAGREIFAAGPTPCSENTSRIGTVTHHVRIGERTVRVACDSRRGAKRLGAALADHLVDARDETPLGFVLTAPQALQRKHRLIERSGLVMSEGRGLDAGLHALASHLTALLPPEPGHVRVRARALIAGDATVVGVFPMLLFPVLAEADLVARGIAIVDRLAIDIEVETGRIVSPSIPWPDLARLAPGRGHAGTGGSRSVSALVLAATPHQVVVPSRASVVAQLAGFGMSGTPADLLDACTRLVGQASLHSAPPAVERLVSVLDELADAH